MKFNIETYLENLPQNTSVIHLQNKNLTHIPNLSKFICLKVLNCSENKLRRLPELPASLEKLICSYNQLIILPELPISLLYLSCSYNPLFELPPLPPKLKYLLCNNNQLAYLPTLPKTLVQLSSYDYLIQDDGDLPGGLEVVVRYDKLTDNEPIHLVQTLIGLPEMLSQVYGSREALIGNARIIKGYGYSNSMLNGEYTDTVFELFQKTAKIIESHFNYFIKNRSG